MPGRATSTGRVAPWMTARAVSPATTRPSRPRCGAPMTTRSASRSSAIRCRPRPGDVSGVTIARACTPASASWASSSDPRLLARQCLDVGPHAAQRERLEGVDVDGDEIPTGEIADTPSQRERVAASLEPVDADDDGGEHGCDLGSGIHDRSLGASRPAAIRVERAFVLRKSRNLRLGSPREWRVRESAALARARAAPSVTAGGSGAARAARADLLALGSAGGAPCGDGARQYLRARHPPTAAAVPPRNGARARRRRGGGDGRIRTSRWSAGDNYGALAAVTHRWRYGFPVGWWMRTYARRAPCGLAR